jgi:hypothetical protein
MRTLRLFGVGFHIQLPVDNLRQDWLFAIHLRDQFRHEATQHLRAIISEIPTQLTSITPHLIISNVRRGSIDLDLLVQLLVSVPWDTVCGMANAAYEVVKEIGAVAGGIVAIQHGLGRIGRSISRRSHARAARDRSPQAAADEGDRVRDDVHVELISSVQILHETVQSPERSVALFKDQLQDFRPRSAVMIMTRDAINGIEKLLHERMEGSPVGLGGDVLLYEFTAKANGLSTLNDAEDGPFVLQNPPAFGLTRITSADLLYDHAMNHPNELELVEVVSDTWSGESDDIQPIVDGGVIDFTDER